MSCAGFNFMKAQNESARFHFWTSHLNALCKLLYVPMNCKSDGSATFEESIDETLLAFKSNIIDVSYMNPSELCTLA